MLAPGFACISAYMLCIHIDVRLCTRWAKLVCRDMPVVCGMKHEDAVLVGLSEEDLHPKPSNHGEAHKESKTENEMDSSIGFIS